MENIDKLCEAVLEARDHRDMVKSNLDKAEATAREAEVALRDAMVGVGQEKASFGERNFAVKTKVSWKTLAANQTALFGVLRKQAPEILKESVHNATLSKFMKDREAEFHDEAPPWWGELTGLVERREESALSITKAR